MENEKEYLKRLIKDAKETELNYRKLHQASVRALNALVNRLWQVENGIFIGDRFDIGRGRIGEFTGFRGSWPEMTILKKDGTHGLRKQILWDHDF